MAAAAAAIEMAALYKRFASLPSRALGFRA